MVILIDQFTGTAGGIDTVVSIYFNTETGEVTTTPDVSSIFFEFFNPPRNNDELIYTQCIAGDKHIILKSTAAPYWTKDIQGDSPDCGVTPPQCDLATQYIKTDESAQGAADGSIGATATSSFANPQVSIDNITFFPTPHVFGPIPPGVYTLYGKDDNGCTSAQQVTIGSFNNPIDGGYTSGLPQVEVAPGLISRWNAAFNPIVLNFADAPDPTKKNLRYEVNVSGIGFDVTGTYSPGIDGKTRADVSAFLQSVVNSRDEFKYDVLNWRDLDRAASFNLKWRQVWNDGSGQWYFAPQPLYVTFSAKQLQSKYGGNMAEYVPMETGGVLAPSTWNCQLLQTSTPDYIDGNVQIKSGTTIYADAFTNSSTFFDMPAGTPYSIEAYVIDGTLAPEAYIRMYVFKGSDFIFAKSIPNVPGASLVYSGIAQPGAEYVVSVVADANPDSLDINIPDNDPVLPPESASNLAKFLTPFEEPTAWQGLPYDNSFILSEYIVDKVLKVRTTSLDINKQPIAGGVINGYLLNNDAGYILGTDHSRLIIQQGALPPVANDGIFEELGINRLMLAGNPALNVEYFQIQLCTGEDNAPEYVTQPLIIKINKPCKDPYIYLKWLNTLGGWDYWRFGKDQLLQLTTADDIVIDRNVFDWENGDTIAEVIKKSAFSKASIGAQVSDKKISGLRELAYSTKVMVLTSLNPIQWQTVRVTPGSFDIRRTRSKVTELRFTITFPEINVQVNGAAAPIRAQVQPIIDA